MIGRGSSIDNDVLIGRRVRVQTNCYLTAHSVIEDDVFIGPGVVTTNDDTMARHPDDEPRRGVTLRRACRIGGGVVLCPGVEVGEEAFVGAGAVVTKDVPPRAVVVGCPAAGSARPRRGPAGELAVISDSGYGDGPVPPGVTNPAVAAPGPGPYRLAEWGPRVIASLIRARSRCRSRLSAMPLASRCLPPGGRRRGPRPDRRVAVLAYQEGSGANLPAESARRFPDAVGRQTV